MLWKPIIFFSALCLVHALAYVTTPTAPLAIGTPWPLPKLYLPSAHTFPVSTSLRFDTTHQSSCNVLQAAVKRYGNLIRNNALTQRAASYIPHNGLSNGRSHHATMRSRRNINEMVSNVRIRVSSACDETKAKLFPSQNMNEDYAIVVKTPSIDINSAEVWGAIRALETLSQIIYRTIDGQLTVNATKIVDTPRYKYRGFMLDTSRHYFSKEVILQNLDAMEQNKMNVFHWHIVDDNSFPYQSKKFPQLSNFGAFSPQSHIYSQLDIEDIVEYARRRGIRVVPEFDSPGHTLSWGAGQNDLLAKCFNKTTKQPTGTYGPLDPTRNSTYDFLAEFFKEITSVFPEEYLHLGGDEVDFSCWLSNPIIVEFMKKHGFGTDGAKLEEYYEKRLVQLLAKVKPAEKNQKIIVWQEVADNGVQLPSSTILHVWKGENNWQKEMASVTKKGYATILSSPWYLNYISYGNVWEKTYAVEPENFNGTTAQKQLVQGGEACMWGEFVDNSNFISTTWPRASVVAERLWSQSSVNSVNKAVPRLEAQRCRMLKRGFNAEPINNRGGYCEQEFAVQWKPT